MSFHFIRPLWLLGLIPVALIVIALVRHKDSRRASRGVVADHLLPYLVSTSSSTKTWLSPHLLLGAALTLVTLALAGPAWQREPAPFADDDAALVVAIEVTPTMLAQDIQPSRLQRATQKIGNLLERRKGSATALVAYSGSAHLVMPLTEDGDLIARFAAELVPEIMPAEGDVADQAIALAQRQLTAAGVAGSVLLVTDGVATDTVSRIASNQTAAQPKVHIYAVGAGIDATVSADSPPAPPLDLANVEAAADAGRGSLVVVSPDSEDIDRLAGTIETQFTDAPDVAGGQRWKDAGYWLTPVIALLALGWFRPGWNIQWQAAAIGAAFLSLGSPTANAQSAFATQDQTAQRLFDAGEFAAAAERYTEPMHQGVAWFRAGEFEQAADAFGRTGTPEGLYNRGNALLMRGNYEAAIASYEQALQSQPDWPEAKANLNLAKLRLARLMAPEDQQSQKAVGEDDRPDEIVFDDRAKNQPDANTEIIAGEGQELSDAVLRAQWLRRVETRPADYLRLKFLYQHKIAELNQQKEDTP